MGQSLKLVERHVIKKDNPMWSEIDQLAFKSKNLYNQANYRIRQSFIFEKKYLNYNAIEKQLKTEECYRALPAKVSQQILLALHRNWVSFFEAMKGWRENPDKFKGRPSFPKYKEKQKGRNLLIYVFGQRAKSGNNKGKRESGAISKRGIKKGLIVPSKTNLSLKTKVSESNLKELRIIPKYGYYVAEVVYEKEVKPVELDEDWVAAVDLGIDNLGTVTSNREGFVPLMVNGRPLKNINQFFNKRRKQLCSSLGQDSPSSKKLERLTMKRNFKVDDYLHKASRELINKLVHSQIGTLVIGQNPGWKQEVNIGRINNQNFVTIPHTRFIQMLTYKAMLVGIKVIVNEESYTSKASFLDGDVIPIYNPKSQVKYHFSGKRIKRGLYRTSTGQLLNADVNGSYNILRKAVPNAFSYGIEAVVVQPVRVTPAK
ncbi:MAG: RNA-guided endonuclease InsQ/TnpB family protein [Xenococcaceae cyanobacterium]